MNDLPSVTLIQQSSAKPKTGEELETLGKQAAALYLSGQMNLTNAVVETVKKAGLSPEQVRRVVEFANTDAYLQEFRKEGSDHRVIEFTGGPADPSLILKDLNDGGGGTVFDRGDGDYSRPPPDVVKTAAVNRNRLGVMEDKLAEAFGLTGSEIPYSDPLQDAWALKQKLAGAHSELTSELSLLESVHLDVCNKMFQQVKQASLEGVPLGDVLKAWHTITIDPAFVKVAFQFLAPKLLENKVFGDKLSIANSIEKTASAGTVNVEHPLVKSYADFCDNLLKMAQIRAVSEELASGVDTLNTFLKQANNKLAASVAAKAVGSTVGKAIESVPKVWKAATEGTKALAPEVAEALGGGTVGKVVGKGVEYAPHIAAGVAAEDVYQRMKYSPAFQAGKNMLMSRIPYTHPYMVRQYQLQMGA
jgi:hypothetical protein